MRGRSASTPQDSQETRPAKVNCTFDMTSRLATEVFEKKIQSPGDLRGHVKNLEVPLLCSFFLSLSLHCET